MHSGFEIPGIQQNDNTFSAPVLLSMNRSNHIFEQIHVLPTSQQPFLEQDHHLLLPLHRSSLGILHCWNGSSLKQQQPFWEPLPAEAASNENSEIVDRQEHIELNQNQITTSMNGNFHFGELEEALYKRCQNNTNTPSHNHHHHLVNNGQNPSDFDHGFEEKRRKKKQKRKKGDSCYYSNELMSPLAEFFSNFVKQMMDHQESLHHKFTEMIEKLDEERRAREEHWRNEEMVHFQQEKMARAREKILKQSREAMIVSYLEKITGQKVNFSCEIASASNANEERLGKKC